jgi:hypothetical protein
MVFEQQRARKEAELQAAAMGAGVKDVESYAAACAKLPERAVAAAQQLALTRLHDRIGFERETMFFSPTDLRVAQELRSVYGSEWRSEFSSIPAVQIRMNEAMRSFNDIGRDAFTGVLQALRGGKVEISPIPKAAFDDSRVNARLAQAYRDLESTIYALVNMAKLGDEFVGFARVSARRKAHRLRRPSS